MIIEARCNVCGKRFGYASVTGVDWYNTPFMKTVRCREMLIEMLCDECRKGRIDIDQTEPRRIEKAKMKIQKAGITTIRIELDDLARSIARLEGLQEHCATRKDETSKQIAEAIDTAIESMEAVYAISNGEKLNVEVTDNGEP